MNSAPPRIAGIWAQIKGAPLLVFVICLMAWTLSNLDQSLFGYAIPGIRDEFGSDLSAIGWILSGSFALAAVMTVVIGLFADRYGRKIMLVITLAVSAFLVGLQGFAPTLVTLGIIRIMAFGVSNGLAPVVVAYTAEMAPNRYRGLMAGFLQCGYPLGWFLGSLIAAPLLGTYGWRAIFMPAFIVVPLAFVLARWLPESRRFRQDQVERESAAVQTEDQPWTAKLRELFSPALRRNTLLCACTFFLHGCAYAGTAFYFPTFYHEVRGYTVEQGTYIVGLSYGIGILGYLGSSIVGEFFLTRRNTFVLWAWIGAVALVGTIWIPDSFAADIAGFSIMAAFFYGGMAVLGTLSAEIFPTRVRVTGSAFAGSLALYLGFAIFPVVMAWAIDQIGWRWAFTVCAIPLALAGLALLGIENFKSGVDMDEIAR